MGMELAQDHTVDPFVATPSDCATPQRLGKPGKVASCLSSPEPARCLPPQQTPPQAPEWELWPLKTTVLPPQGAAHLLCPTPPGPRGLPLCVTVAGRHLFQGRLQVGDPPDGRLQVRLEGLSHCRQLLHVLLLETDTAQLASDRNPSQPRALGGETDPGSA